MSVVDRVAAAREERRTIGGVPWQDAFLPFGSGGPAHPSAAGQGDERALGLTAIYGAARLLADAVASLPLHVYRGAPGPGPAARVSTGLFSRCPSATGTLYDWLHIAMVSLILRGNAYGMITTRDGFGFPQGIEWLNPNQVTVAEDEQQPWNPMRTRIYYYGREIDRSQLVHIRAFAMAGRTEGLSPLRVFQSVIEQGHGAMDYATSWFDAGGFPPGTFKNAEQEIDKTQADEIRRRLTSSIRRREPIVYGRDWTYETVTVPPDEAQFVETVRLNATQWAAVYGVPPERIGGDRGGSLTYSNQENAAIAFQTETVRPWLVRLENAFFDLLPAGQFARFNADAMLKVTTKERHEIYQIDRNIGLRSVDEIREIEDLEPLPDGKGIDPSPLLVQVAQAKTPKPPPASPAGAAAQKITAPPGAGAVHSPLPPSAGGPPPMAPAQNGKAPPAAARQLGVHRGPGDRRHRQYQ